MIEDVVAADQRPASARVLAPERDELSSQAEGEDTAPLLKPADISLVRIAQPEDIEGLMALARLMHREIGMLPLDEGKVRAAISHAVHGGLVGVTGHPEVHGCMCLQIGEAWYTRTRQANEFMFFVHPEHRRAGYARSLLAWGKFMSDGIGMPFAMAIFGNKRNAGKIRLCERQLEQVGAVFMHNRPAVQSNEKSEGVE